MVGWLVTSRAPDTTAPQCFTRRKRREVGTKRRREEERGSGGGVVIDNRNNKVYIDQNLTLNGLYYIGKQNA